MRLRALAKINLGLDVLGRREDGYHELRMIMQTINMYDQLDMEISEEPGIRITTNLPYVPVNQNNLVYRAANMLMDKRRSYRRFAENDSCGSRYGRRQF